MRTKYSLAPDMDDRSHGIIKRTQLAEPKDVFVIEMKRKMGRLAT